MKIRTSRDPFWVEIGEGTDKARVLVEPLSQTDLNRLRKKHTVRKFKRGQWIEDTNFYELHRDRLVMMIKNWEGIYDEHDEAISCTPDNVLLISDLNDWFITELLDKVDAVMGTQDAETGN